MTKPSFSDSPAEVVRRQIRAGEVKKKCCRSAKRCRRCPVLALRRAKAAQPEGVSK